MTRKVLVSILLLAAVAIPFIAIPNASSQPGGASFTVVTVNTPPPYQCALLPLEFTAQRGQAVGGYFTADVTLDVYVLSQTDYYSFVQTNTCQLPRTAYPLFMQTQVYGSNNAYNAVIPSNGVYYILFVYRNNGISQITSGYATIDLSYPPFITLTQVSPTAAATTFTSSNSSMLTVNTPVPEFPLWGTAIPLVLSIFLVAVIIRRRRN